MNRYNFIKVILLSLVIILFWSSVSFGQSSSSLNLSIPTAPGSYQSDRFKAGDLDCTNAIGSATNLEFGVTGIIGRGYTDPLNGYVDSRVGDVGVFARIIIPLGKKPKSRVDCNRLYELELRKKQLEVMRLEQEIQQLRALQFQG
ncbi:MAG: hypothetical protein P8I31_01590 [Bacteroidia bacterium]|nr:hypothetical protein [Bacteroidia bacterium]